MADLQEPSSSEVSPLLREGEPEQRSREPPLRLPVKDQRRIVMLLSIVIFFFASAGSLFSSPLTRILEDNLCQHHFGKVEQRNTPIDEKLCKTDKIQSELAYLLGFMSALEAIVCLAVAFPYGILSDKSVYRD